MKPALGAFPLALVLALVACGSEPEPVETPTPSPTADGPRTLVAAGFSDQELGPRIVGPDGDEVSSTLTFEGRTIAEMVSHVTCPPPEDDEITLDECIPAEQPEGTVYTYVHRVTPADGEGGRIFSFRTTRPVAGFANNIGFDREQATAALGEDGRIGVSMDNGVLIWRVEEGDGWDEGEEITLFWQSTSSPDGPAEAFELETANGTAIATGPFPKAELADDE